MKISQRAPDSTTQWMIFPIASVHSVGVFSNASYGTSGFATDSITCFSNRETSEGFQHWLSGNLLHNRRLREQPHWIVHDICCDSQKYLDLGALYVILIYTSKSFSCFHFGAAGATNSLGEFVTHFHFELSAPFSGADVQSPLGHDAPFYFIFISIYFIV